MPPVLYLPVSAITPKVGMALYQTSGKLAAAGGANLATYISMTERSAACTAGELIPVVRILPSQVWMAPKDSSSALSPGALVDVKSGGMGIDDDGTDGANFEVIEAPDSASGSMVKGRFVFMALIKEEVSTDE